MQINEETKGFFLTAFWAAIVAKTPQNNEPNKNSVTNVLFFQNKWCGSFSFNNKTKCCQQPGVSEEPSNNELGNEAQTLGAILCSKSPEQPGVETIRISTHLSWVRASGIKIELLHLSAPQVWIPHPTGFKGGGWRREAQLNWQSWYLSQGSAPPFTGSSAPLESSLRHCCSSSVCGFTLWATKYAVKGTVRIGAVNWVFACGP